MSTESEVESAFKTGLVAAGITATFRSFWLDDASGETNEAQVYPVVVLDTKPAMDMGYRQGVWTVPMDVMVLTHYVDDKKRSALLALYDQVRDVLNARNFQTDFTSISSSLTFNAVVVTGGSTGVIENEQAVTLSLNWEVA